MIIDANPLVLCLRNFRKRVQIEIYDESEAAVDATELDLQVQDMGEAVIMNDSYTSPPPGGSRIEHPATGRYYIDWGDPNASANTPNQTETATPGKYLFIWRVVGAAGTEEEQRNQTVEVVSAPLMDLIRELQSQLDKARKDVSVSPTDFCPLGYTEGMLLEYLRGGLSIINSYQPYPTWCSLETFDRRFQQTLIDAAMVVGVNAQTLFAIDSDVEQWNNQGNAFVINHQPKLAAFSQALSQRLDKIIPIMKLHFVKVGSAKVEVGPGYRLAQLIQSAPSGALFRNFITRA